MIVNSLEDKENSSYKLNLEKIIFKWHNSFYTKAKNKKLYTWMDIHKLSGELNLIKLIWFFNLKMVKKRSLCSRGKF